MAYWLMKSEPGVYSWARMEKDGKTAWNGVRNHQAGNNMKAMQPGDEAFFYHSNEDRAVVGIVKVVKAWHPDPSDPSGKFGMVAVAAAKPLKNPVTLSAIKADPRLAELALVRQSRLSVSPVPAAAWKIICGMGGV